MKPLKRRTTEERRPDAKPRLAKPYCAPAIVWEQRFVALAQASPQPCIPGSDPSCPGFGMDDPRE